jgi:glycine dehydrogenase subunit 2
MEMTRYSLDELARETGVTVIDVQNRMTDFGIDAPWLSHEPWLVPEPITPEAGELWSKEDLDYWVDALAEISREASTNPEVVTTSPHRQPVHRLDTTHIEDPEKWAMTWRAFQRKRRGRPKDGHLAEQGQERTVTKTGRSN